MQRVDELKEKQPAAYNGSDADVKTSSDVIVTMTLLLDKLLVCI
jgi:hypothetical protein